MPSVVWEQSPPHPCECGCGYLTNPGCRFIQHHHLSGFGWKRGDRDEWEFCAHCYDWHLLDAETIADPRAALYVDGCKINPERVVRIGGLPFHWGCAEREMWKYGRFPCHTCGERNAEMRWGVCAWSLKDKRRAFTYGDREPRPYCRRCWAGRIRSYRRIDREIVEHTETLDYLKQAERDLRSWLSRTLGTCVPS